MTTELTRPLSGRGFAPIRDASILSYIGGTDLSTKQWVILGMELEYQALGSIIWHNYNIVHAGWIENDLLVVRTNLLVINNNENSNGMCRPVQAYLVAIQGSIN